MPKAKVIKMKGNSGFEEIVTQLMDMEKGDSKENLLIILDKYARYKEIIHTFLTHLVNLQSCIPNPDSLRSVTKKLLEDYRRYSIPLEYNYIDFEQFSDEECSKIKSTYFRMVESDLILILVKICTNIRKSNVNVMECDKYYANGILVLLEDIDSPEIMPMQDITDPFLYNLLKQISVTGKELYNLFYSPDTDTTKIFDLLVTLLNGMKNEMRGCKRGLQLISKSREIFEGNFNKYYRASKRTENPFCFMTDFIQDIIEDNSKADLQTKDLVEVKKVGNRIRKMMAEKMKNAVGMSSKMKETVSNIDVLFSKLLDGGEINMEDTQEFIDQFNIGKKKD